MITFYEGTAKFRSGYSDTMIDNPDYILKRMEAEMEGVEYDTIVGRGSSGMLIVPLLAQMLGKNWLVIRKEEEYEGSHSGIKWLGDLGSRWIFLDDFCSSGQTFREVRDGIKEAIIAVNRTEWFNPETQRFVRRTFSTELVGYFEYEDRNGEKGWHAWDEQACPGYSDYYNDDMPKAAAERERRLEEAAQEVRQIVTDAAGDRIANPDFCCETCTPYMIDGKTEVYNKYKTSWAKSVIFDTPPA